MKKHEDTNKIMIGKKIRELRKKHNLNQEDLAEKLGVSTSMVGMYETEVRNPSYEVLIKISSYFKVSTDYLLGVKEVEENLELPENQKNIKSKSKGDSNMKKDNKNSIVLPQLIDTEELKVLEGTTVKSVHIPEDECESFIIDFTDDEDNIHSIMYEGEEGIVFYGSKDKNKLDKILENVIGEAVEIFIDETYEHLNDDDGDDVVSEFHAINNKELQEELKQVFKDWLIKNNLADKF